MERKPEQHELMKELAQAEAYAESDFTEPHNKFVAHFKKRFPKFSKGLVLDIGCGNADPTIRFARTYPKAKLVGLDGSEAMLSFGHKAVEEAGLSKQIELKQGLLNEGAFPPSSFDAVICNSLLHHLENPQTLWKSIKKITKAGAPVIVMDLTRPPTQEHARELVALHAEGAPELMARDFYNSLLAAFRLEEVRQQLDEAGLSKFHVEVVSDRHMLIFGRV